MTYLPTQGQEYKKQDLLLHHLTCSLEITHIVNGSNTDTGRSFHKLCLEVFDANSNISVVLELITTNVKKWMLSSICSIYHLILVQFYIVAQISYLIKSFSNVRFNILWDGLITDVLTATGVIEGALNTSVSGSMAVTLQTHS